MTVSSHSKLTRPRNDSFSGPDLRLFVKDLSSCILTNHSNSSHNNSSQQQSKKRPITVKTWSTIKDVKDEIKRLLHVPPSNQRLYFGPGSDLPNHRTLHDAGIYRSGETLFLAINDVANSTHSSISQLRSTGANDVCISPSLLDLAPKDLRRRVQLVRRGFMVGLKPDLVLDGSGGTYFLHDARKARVGVFKPADEEPYAENNPRGYLQSGGGGADGEDSMSMRAGIKPGEACLREVAAFLLDHEGFSGVPMTTLAESRHPGFNHDGSMLKLNQGGAAVGIHSLRPSTSHHHYDNHTEGSSAPKDDKKVGSFQEYVRAECTMDDISPSLLPTHQVHKIAILDIRTLNADRNAANLLCNRNRDDPDKFELTPIDHGFCLKTVADVCSFDWCWLEWPQMKLPLDERSREYVLGLDVEEDVRMLEERLRIPEKALDYFRASSRLLQAGVRAGMSLYDIACICCRIDDFGELPSDLESLMSTANEVARSAVHNGRWHHADASRALAEQLSPDNNHNNTSLSSTSSPSRDHLSMISTNSLPIRKGPNRQHTMMTKSMSSINFSSFSSTSSSSSPPPPIQSSCSDSGSEEDDNQDHEDDEGNEGESRECDEWAKGVIQDTFDSFKSPPPVSPGVGRRQRAFSTASQDSSSDSSSDSSESSSGSSDDDDEDDTTSDDASSRQLSSSPVGFWCRPPSSKKPSQDFSWSPHISPKSSPFEPNLLEDATKRTEGQEKKRGMNVMFDHVPELIPPRPTRLVDDEDERFSLPPPMKVFGLKRSRSYSAFGSGDAVLSTEDGNAAAASDGQFRVELMKFIDLLITRLVRQRGPSSPGGPSRSMSTSMSMSTTSPVLEDGGGDGRSGLALLSQ